MSREPLVSQLRQELVSALEPLHSDCAAAAHVDALRCELQNSTLTQEREGSVTEGPVLPWQQLFPRADDWPAPGLPALVNQLIPLCRWFRGNEFYTRPEDRHFAERLWGAELVGHDGGIFSCGQRFILLLIILEPDTLYPLHAHRIEETYLVLAGRGEWTHDGHDWAQLEAGDSFHNESWQAHAIRTGAEPVMTLGIYLPPFGWEGGLL